ncbi:hypothetical protein BDD12DRAFT_47060 [Trichophaea hybrida]|nr:hypothetical protein BDD12DRAFT_47060 [Trichophaea hybrida]
MAEYKTDQSFHVSTYPRQNITISITQLYQSCCLLSTALLYLHLHTLQSINPIRYGGNIPVCLVYPGCFVRYSCAHYTHTCIPKTRLSSILQPRGFYWGGLPIAFFPFAWLRLPIVGNCIRLPITTSAFAAAYSLAKT